VSHKRKKFEFGGSVFGDNRGNRGGRALSVPDEGHFRNAPYALILICTFLSAFTGRYVSRINVL
jgi:hypothetical protein